jgi:hypothetical protein
MTQLKIISETLISCLTPDLLSSKWVQLADPNNPVSGHCAIATECMYDILGGARAGYLPFVCSYHYNAGGTFIPGLSKSGVNMTHWWLRRPKQSGRGRGEVYDVSVNQYKEPFKYYFGRPSGFMSPTPPSKRARILLSRIEAKLDPYFIMRFRDASVKSFEDAGGEAKLGKADQFRFKQLQGTQ